MMIGTRRFTSFSAKNEAVTGVHFSDAQYSLYTRSSDLYVWHRLMIKSTVTILRTLFLSSIDDGDKMRNCWRSLCHNDKYVAINRLALMDVFGPERRIMDSIFRKKYESGSLIEERKGSCPLQ